MQIYNHLNNPLADQPTHRRIKLRVSNGSTVNYCYILIDEVSKEAIAIDPAWDIDLIHKTISQYGAKLRAIFVTHHHKDHFDLANTLSMIYLAPVWMSLQEVEYYKISLDNLNTFDKDMRLMIGSFSVQAIVTPGHTFGSACYLIDECLYTGDTLFIEGCGLCRGKGSSAQELFRSLQKIKNIIPLNTKIYPGHRYARELGASFSYLLRHNIYLCIDDEEVFVRFRMRENQRNLFDFI